MNTILKSILIGIGTAIACIVFGGLFAGFFNGFNFGVSRGYLFARAPVVPSAYYFAVAYNNCADGNFALFKCFLRALKRAFHKFNVHIFQ